MRFTLRDVLLLTVIVALVVALLIERRARRDDQLATVRWTSEEEREWANERFKAAKAEFQQTESYWRGPHSGRADLFEACSAIERYAQAAEELPGNAETRAKELSAALSFAKDFETIIHEKVDNEVEPLYRLNRAQYTRADVETRLKRVQREAVLERSRK